jgi:3-dehydroquinate synthetase
MATDKKWLAGKSRFVLLNGPQQPAIVEGVSREDILAVLDEVQ